MTDERTIMWLGISGEALISALLSIPDTDGDGRGHRLSMLDLRLRNVFDVDIGILL